MSDPTARERVIELMRTGFLYGCSHRDIELWENIILAAEKAAEKAGRRAGLEDVVKIIVDTTVPNAAPADEYERGWDNLGKLLESKIRALISKEARE